VSGRGRWYRWDKKDTVDGHLKLTAHQLARSVDLERPASLTWQWTRTSGSGRERKSSISLRVLPGVGVQLDYSYQGQPVEPYLVRWTTTTPHYGGRRYWWLCPACSRRCAHLYGGHPFLCRECHGLTYSTAQSGGELTETIDNRLIRLRRKLGGGRFLDPPPEKPERMHWQTYERLCCEYWNLMELRNLAFNLQLVNLLGATGGMEAAGLPSFEVLGEVVGYKWRAFKKDPAALPALPRRLAWEWVEREREARKAQRAARRGTLGEIARAAAVPVDFAREAQAHGLLRPDSGRGKRRKRYRRKLARWLEKLYLLNQSGYSWQDLASWTRRRFQPGHEHERRYPAGFNLHQTTGER
jgi:hypothetical protein